MRSVEQRAVAVGLAEPAELAGPAVVLAEHSADFAAADVVVAAAAGVVLLLLAVVAPAAVAVAVSAGAAGAGAAEPVILHSAGRAD